MEDFSGEQNDRYRRSHSQEFFVKLFLEIFTGVGLISITANILIIFVILKFKKLRQNVTNIIIAHMAILQSVYLLITPLSIRVIMGLTEHISFMNMIPFYLICVFNEFEFVIVLITILLVVLLIFDSFFKLYYEDRYVKFCRVYKFIIVLFYFSGILVTTISCQICFGAHFMWFGVIHVDLLIYISLGILLIIMNIIHLFKRRTLGENKNNTGLCLANIFFILWVPAFVSLIRLLLYIDYDPAIALFLFILGNSSPIVNFLYLMYFDKNFNIFFKKVFKCQCNDYSNETLDNQVVAYSEETGVEFKEN